MKENFKSVLVSAPTAAVKMYCFEEWLENVMQFTYPNFKIRLFDNTLSDNGLSAKKMNDHFEKYYGSSDKFHCHYITDNHDKKEARVESVIHRMSVSHNDCRQELLKGGYDMMLHLETDVFPERDVIERLLLHKRKVVGSLYYRDEGKSRRLMGQNRIYRSPNNIVSENLSAKDDIFVFDGSLKQFAHIGLGCVLIARPVLEKIQFRYVKGENIHPDSYFAEDCFRNKIKIFADTSLVCRHENKRWGVPGVDYK